MILSEEQLQQRKDSPENLSNIIHKILGKGQHRNQSRGDSKALDVETQALIGLTAKMDTVKNTAKAFGVSPASVNAYKSGVTSLNPTTRSESKSESLKELVNSKAAKVSGAAVDILMDALDRVDLDDTKEAIKLTNVAKNLSDIHEKMRPQEERNTGVKVTILSPSQRQLTSYDIIDVTIQKED